MIGLRLDSKTYKKVNNIRDLKKKSGRWDLFVLEAILEKEQKEKGSKKDGRK